MNLSISMKSNDESNFVSDFKQSSDSILIFTHIFKEKNQHNVPIELRTSILNDLATCTQYRSPLETPTILWHRVPACILLLMNSMIRVSLIKIPNLPLIPQESDSVYLWQCTSTLDIKLIAEITILKDYQSLKALFICSIK